MHLTLYLFRPSVEFDGELLRKSASGFLSVDLVDLDGIDGARLYVKPAAPKEPPWVRQVRPLLAGELPAKTLNQSSAAVLFVHAHQRVFALTFGQGFQAIDSKLLEPGFGLRVTANSVAINQVTGGDMMGHGKGAPSRRVALPQASDLYQLGVEPDQEWMKRLSGQVDPSFAAKAVGADSLRLSIKDFDLEDLGAKLGQILERHTSTDYRQRYSFLDNLQQLRRDDPLIWDLDKKAEELLQARDTDIGFAPPEPFEQNAVAEYEFKYRRRETSCELLGTDEVFGALDTIGEVDRPLAQIHITAISGNGFPIGRRLELRDYLQVELPGDDASTRYILSGGLWFRVAATWVREVNDFVRGIDDISNQLNLPVYDLSELKRADDDNQVEGSYNKKLSRERGYILLDKDDVHIGGPNQKIEVCDLLSREKQLICVKRATRSAALSHLFAQASVSASLIPEEKYQEHVIEAYRRFDSNAKYEGPSGWTFVYAIATEKSTPLADSLFFFSKVNLVTHTRDIRSRGFQVAIAKIPIVKGE